MVSELSNNGSMVTARIILCSFPWVLKELTRKCSFDTFDKRTFSAQNLLKK